MLAGHYISVGPRFVWVQRGLVSNTLTAQATVWVVFLPLLMGLFLSDFFVHMPFWFALQGFLALACCQDFCPSVNPRLSVAIFGFSVLALCACWGGFCPIVNPRPWYGGVVVGT